MGDATAREAGPKVAVAGQVGSGKSTVTRLMATVTGWSRFSTGELFRRIAAERAMTPLELNVYARSHPEIDDEVDGRLAALADDPDPMVIDSRMAFHFVPEAFKVYLAVDPWIGAERIFRAGRADEDYASVEEAAAKSAAREREEAARYAMLYGVDPPHWRNYDLVIDTTHCPPEEVVARILADLGSADGRAGAPHPRCLLSPRRLVPSDGMAGDGIPAVVVAAGDTVILTGHTAVAAALAAGAALVECRLAAFELEPVAGQPSALAWAQTAVSPAGLAAWEREHGIRFAAPPSWLRR